jgi:hypothetical protein
MADRQTIFYSWQSDTPAAYNRAFIEAALNAAIGRVQANLELVPALREVLLEVDLDTKGVSGSPPITQTILEKIQKCTAFVADITFVGRSLAQLRRRNPRLFPNPNALMEYGYALKCVGHGRMISVMNTAFGQPAENNLPFDLRHLRWPITYQYDQRNADQRDAIFEDLVSNLTDQLTAILQSQRNLITEDIRLFEPQTSAKDPAVFFDSPEGLIAEGLFGREAPTFSIPAEGRGYLRLYPTRKVDPIDSELTARTLASNGALRPMGLDISGWTPARNRFGAIVYEGPNSGKLYNLTQLFLSRELWGIDAFVVNAAQCREFSPKFGKGYIASLFVERTFVSALANYLKFAEESLQLPPPLNIRVGLTGIKGYPMATEAGFVGGILHDAVEWNGVISSYGVMPHDVLRPWFDKIWKQCGLVRPEKCQQKLEQEFGTAA